MFSKYGRINNPKSDLYISQFLFVRHGRSNANRLANSLRMFEEFKDKDDDKILNEFWDYQRHKLT